MAIDSSIKETLRHLPRAPGVYLFKDGQGSVIYIGKAKILKNRVKAYFNPRGIEMEGRPKIRVMVKHIRRIETIVVKNEAEALILESRLLKEYKPKYNTAFVDDKKFYLVRVTPERLPRFLLERNKTDAQSVYYGPFVSGPSVTKLLTELKRKHGILLRDGAPKELIKKNKINNKEDVEEIEKFQLYDDARGQMFDLPNVVTREEYMMRVAKACAMLEGKTREWKQEAVEKMQAAATAERYEEAAKWRDLISAMQMSRNPERKFLRDPLMKNLDSELALASLKKSLKMEEAPISIECFDISHISGSFVVASLVRFDDGKPNKDFYKRFKIRGDEMTGPVNDDFAAMREVVGRHYRRRVDENQELPKLIVIDGGAGQLKAALAAFLEHGLRPPMMIGLAKKNETFIFSDGRGALTLRREDPGLQLLQRVRDEAHRVANGFNSAWRSRQMKVTLLDDCPGVGPTRRAALLAKFPSIESLKKASLQRLAKVVGPKLAGVVKNYLLEKSTERP